MSQISSDQLDFQRGVQSEPLNDRDLEMIHRFLSDPTVFPREFKRWITEHASDTVDIAKTQVHGLINSTGQVVIGGASIEMLGATLVGFVIPYPSATPPAGWLLCDGHEILRADYAALFTLLGTSQGAPSDGTKFKLPDYRDRTLFGAGAIVALNATDGQAVGSRGGPYHYHSLTGQTDAQGNHSHNVSVNVSGGISGSTDTQGQHAHTYRRHTEAGQTFTSGTAGSSFTLNVTGGFDASTSENGNHNHNVSGSFSGSGGGSTDGQGVHQHNISGTTTGGYVRDAPAWAGVNYIMGSGKVPA